MSPSGWAGLGVGVRNPSWRPLEVVLRALTSRYPNDGHG